MSANEHSFMPGQLSQGQIEDFDRNGFVLLPDLIPLDRIDSLAREFDAVVDRNARMLHFTGQLPDVAEGETFERRLASLYRLGSPKAARILWRAVQGKHHKTAAMFALMTAPTLLGAVESIIGPEILAHPQFNSRAKVPNQLENIAPWHQDLAFLGRSAAKTRMVNFWIPLIDAEPDTGVLKVIPGSHRWGLLPHRPLGEFFGIPVEAIPRRNSAIECPMRRGAALMMQHTLIHSSGINYSDRVRWSVDIRYCDRRARTGWELPGFVCKSVEQPGLVARSHEDWVSIMEAHGMVEGGYPGSCCLQDTLPVLASGGRVLYQQTLVDGYSRVAFAKLYERKDARSAINLIETRALPFFQDRGCRVARVLTDRGMEYGGAGRTGSFTRFLAARGIEHVKTRATNPQLNLACGNFHSEIAEEFYRSALASRMRGSINKLQGDLDAWLEQYNRERISKRWGQAPLEAFECSAYLLSAP